MSVPALAFLCDLMVELGEPIEMGEVAGGRRRIIPIVGGIVEGERLRGRVLDVGADWQTVHADGTAELDTRYALESHDGAVIEIMNYGYRHGSADVMAALARGEQVDPSLYYMRTQARFKTGDLRYSWLNSIVAVGSGARERAAVRISIFEVL